jgi:hypothetical protein
MNRCLTALIAIVPVLVISPAGDGSGSPVKERTNVVLVTMPDDRGARFTF